MGIDGSETMLKKANGSGLYQDLKLCLLGDDPLPVQSGSSLFIFTVPGVLVEIVWIG